MKKILVSLLLVSMLFININIVDAQNTEENTVSLAGDKNNIKSPRLTTYVIAKRKAVLEDIDRDLCVTVPKGTRLEFIDYGAFGSILVEYRGRTLYAKAADFI